MKLELKHLAPYLPYSLNVNQYEEDFDISIQSQMLGLSSNDAVKVSLPRFPGIETVYYKDIKPILRPLSDLNKVYNEKHGLTYMGFINMSKHQYKTVSLINYVHNEVSYYNFQYLLRYHFDVFGLIPKGLAVDINTI